MHTHIKQTGYFVFIIKAININNYNYQRNEMYLFYRFNHVYEYNYIVLTCSFVNFGQKQKCLTNGKLSSNYCWFVVGLNNIQKLGTNV